MKNTHLKFILIIIILGLSCAFSWKLYFEVYNQPDTVDINLFPRTIGQWRSEEITITEDEYEILETRNVFARRYFTDNGKEVFLFIVYSQHNRKVSHPPEICFTGSGVSVIDNRHDYIEVPELKQPIRANKLLLEYGDVNQLAYYWFKVGDRFTSNYLHQQVMIAAQSILGKPASSALIRILATIDSQNMAAAEDNIKEFSRAVVPLLAKYLP